MKKLSIRKPRVSRKSISKESIKKATLGFKQTVGLLVVGSLLLFGASGYYWYQNIFTDPDRILSDMLDKSLQTSSLYRSVSQKSGQGSVDQELFTSFSPEVIAHSITRLQEINDLGRTTVVTETIGTQDTDIVRYTDINIEGQSNVKRNFDNVLNAWGKRVADPQNGQTVSFLNDALFVVVPFGNMNSSQRSEMKDEIQKVNLYDYTSAKKSNENGRPMMTYAIDLDPKALVGVLAKYVKISGIGDDTSLNPAAYEGATRIQIELKVDMLSRHVKSIDFVNSGRNEEYKGYNLRREVEFPSETIDINELQMRLQEIEKQG